MLEEFLFADTDSSQVAFLDEPRTPAGLIQLACALHAVSTLLVAIRDLFEWFGKSWKDIMSQVMGSALHVRESTYFGGK